MNIVKVLMIAVVVSFIASCTSVPLRTMYHMSKTDFMVVDLADLRAAIRIPYGLTEDTKGIEIKLSSWIDGDEENASKLEVKLEKVADEDELKVIESLKRPMTNTFFYKLSASDIELIDNFRNEHKSRKALLGNKLKGSFDVAANYCRTEVVTSRPILVSNWLQISKDSGLLPLFKDKNLIKELRKASVPEDEILPLCSE